MTELIVNNGRKRFISTALVVVILPVLYFCILWVFVGSTPLRWDAGWYRNIAENGYRFNGDIWTQNSVAFLPGASMFLWLIRIVFQLNYEHAQILSSIITYAIGSVCFLIYLEGKMRVEAAGMTIIFLTFSPFGIYLFNGYSESLFYCIVGAFIVSLEKRKFVICSLLVGFGIITRPHGIILLPILWAWWAYPLISRGGGASNICRSLLSSMFHGLPLMLLALMIPMALTVYYYVFFGDSLIYANALTAWHGSKSSLPFFFERLFDWGSAPISKTHLVKRMDNYLNYSVEPVKLACTLFLINCITLIIFSKKLIKNNLSILFSFQLGIIFFSILTGSFPNFGRHTIFLFPMAIVAALLLNDLYSWCIAGNFSNKINSAGGIAVFVLIVSVFLLSFSLFVQYGLMQLNGIWVS